MTDEQKALSRRAVACRGWESMGGMLYADGAWRARVGEGWHWRAGAEVLPVLDDPATLGCLLSLVREAWESPKANISWVTDDNCMVVFDPRHAQRFLLTATEAEALVAALEGAP